MSGLPRRHVNETAADVHAAAVSFVRRLRCVPPPAGLSWPRTSALALAVKNPGLTMSELAAAESVTMPTMTRIVDALERQGLIALKHDREDRRAVSIVATAKGRALLERAREERIGLVARALAQLDREDVEVLNRSAAALERLSELLG